MTHRSGVSPRRHSSTAVVKVAKVPAESLASGLYKKYLPSIQKRDGRTVPFAFEKIVNAIHKAMMASKSLGMASLMVILLMSRLARDFAVRRKTLLPGKGGGSTAVGMGSTLVGVEIGILVP